MLRFQAIEAMLPESRDEMDVHRDAVGRQRVLPDERCGDVLDPVREPLLDRPATARPCVPTRRRAAFSSARTFRVTSAWVPMTCRRSGRPSSRTPTVTRPCQKPSLPE